MPAKSFSTDLWNRDMAVLASSDQRMAVSTLIYSCLEVGCSPYHRASKSESMSDRQTILRHPSTDLNCLVLSVVPSSDPSRSYAFRLDFFDKRESVHANFGQIERAPDGQWLNKGERRLVVPQEAKESQVRQLVDEIVNRAS